MNRHCPMQTQVLKQVLMNARCTRSDTPPDGTPPAPDEDNASWMKMMFPRWSAPDALMSDEDYSDEQYLILIRPWTHVLSSHIRFIEDAPLNTGSPMQNMSTRTKASWWRHVLMTSSVFVHIRALTRSIQDILPDEHTLALTRYWWILPPYIIDEHTFSWAHAPR
jgi:hypothetical protein